MASPLEILLESAAEQQDIKALRDLIKGHGVEKIMKHYDRLSRRRFNPTLSVMLSWLLGFRSETAPYVTLLFAQPVVLDLTKLQETQQPYVPSSMQKTMLGLYGLTETTPLQFSPALISPLSLKIYSAEECDRHLVDPPIEPFASPGYHFRVILVKVTIHHLKDIQIANPKPTEQLLRTCFKAERVVLLPPVEVFNVWHVYDKLNS